MGVDDNQEAKMKLPVRRPGQTLVASAVAEETEFSIFEEEERPYSTLYTVETAALDSIQAAAFTAKQRSKLAKEGEALPDGSFPIRNSSDLSNAISALGRAKDEAKAKAHIVSRARELKLTDSLPDGWLTAAGPPKEPLYGDGDKQTCHECGGESPADREVCQHCQADLKKDELTAAAAGMVPVNPPAEWFDDPKLKGPTPLTITADGRLYGHLALWDTCHIANPRGAGVCVQPPRSKTGYSFFHLGQVLAADGRSIPVGQITMDAPHVGAGVDAREVSRHYDHTGHAGADVRVGDDEFGIYTAGALRPTVTASAARTLMGAKLSGDWRGMKVGGRSNLELVGILAVNVPGFPVPRPQVLVADGVAEDDEPRLALVAAGIVPDPTPDQLRAKARALAVRVTGGLSGLLQAAGFDESKHPRNAPKGKDGKRSPDDGGKFTSSKSGGSREKDLGGEEGGENSGVDYSIKDGKVVFADKSQGLVDLTDKELAEVHADLSADKNADPQHVKLVEKTLKGRNPERPPVVEKYTKNAKLNLPKNTGLVDLTTEELQDLSTYLNAEGVYSNKQERQMVDNVLKIRKEGTSTSPKK